MVKKLILSLVSFMIGSTWAIAQSPYLDEVMKSLSESNIKAEFQYLSEEEVKSWCEQEPDSLKNVYYTKNGISWHTIYEFMKTNSFAYIPFNEEIYCLGFENYGSWMTQYLKRSKRKFCKCPLEELILIPYRSPEYTWRALCGFEGYLVVCRKHIKQVGKVILTIS